MSVFRMTEVGRGEGFDSQIHESANAIFSIHECNSQMHKFTNNYFTFFRFHKSTNASAVVGPL